MTYRLTHLHRVILTLLLAFAASVAFAAAPTTGQFLFQRKPSSGAFTQFGVTPTTGYVFGWDGTNVVMIDPTAGAVLWGGITGTMSNQTDLQTALNLKQSTAGVLALGGFSGITGTVPLANLGSTTVGGNLLTLANPSAVSFLRINADNTVTARTPAQTASDISAATSSDNLSFFAPTTSAQLAGIISNETGGAGVLMFNTSPTVNTSIVAGSSTMALLNTTATTVNAFGAAANITLGGVNTTGISTTSQVYMPLNSLSSGTGFYMASGSLTSGKMFDIVVSSSFVTGSIKGLDVSLSGGNLSSIVTTTGAAISNTRTGSSSTNIALTLTASGGTTNTALNVTSGGVVIGTSGTAILKVISSTSFLDFPNTLAGTVSDLTITLTGANIGDVVILGIPSTSIPSAGSYSAWVSSSGIVTVRYANNALVTAYNPNSGTFRATVIQH